MINSDVDLKNRKQIEKQLKITNILETPFNQGTFGAEELKKHYSKNYSIGLIIAVVFHFILIGSFYFIESLSGDEENVTTIKVMKYIELGPPPSIVNDVPPEVPITTPKIKPKAGVPVAAPKEKVPPEQTIESQQESNQVGTGDGTPVQVIPPTVPPKVEKKVEEPPHYFVAVDQMPEPLGGMEAIQSKIVYTEEAKKAGIEGVIYIKVFIDEKGSVNKVVLQKGLGGGLDESAVRVVRETRFKPGKQAGKPVKVQLMLAINCKIK